MGYRIRTAALKHHVPYITTLAALRAAVAAICRLKKGQGAERFLYSLVQRNSHLLRR